MSCGTYVPPSNMRFLVAAGQSRRASAPTGIAVGSKRGVIFHIGKGCGDSPETASRATGEHDRLFQKKIHRASTAIQSTRNIDA
jgi:hypothetical protein